MPCGAPLGEIWASIPSLHRQPLGENIRYLPPLRFRQRRFDETEQEIEGLVYEIPKDLDAYTDLGEAITKFLSGYLALAQSSQRTSVWGERGGGRPIGHGLNTLEALRYWPLAADPIDWGQNHQLSQDFEWSRTLAYLGDNDRWVFPSLGGAEIPLHPLLAWWALLFALSMLARYEPASWTRHLNVDERSTAVMLGTALSLALDVCPQLILHATRSVGGP